MPSSKQSTSTSERFLKNYLKEKAAEGDYQCLLNELLAIIHRDGGQYTELAGYAVSVEDAIHIVNGLRERISSLTAKNRTRG